MKLRNYQEKAVGDLLRNAADLLSKSGGKRMIFRAPTGAGKTLMAAEFLARLADSRKAEFCCIWIAPGKLHSQSRDKLKKYYEESRALECRYFAELGDKWIGDREILFLNWEGVRQKEKNIIVRENEREFYLSKVLENTRAARRAIILVVDESHRAARTEISEELVADIAADIAVEVSATPEFKDENALVRVDLDDVKAEEMIKKSVVLNDGFGNAISTGGISTADNLDEAVLRMALARRVELAAAFAAEGANVNPLLCIQLPNGGDEQKKKVRRLVDNVLSQNGITETNRKLAIYLADEKENLETISRNDDDAEVMIFKQAIALGWDCPRAHILVLFREWTNAVFSVQTLGRIMRMPEPDKGHYKNETLNRGYVYTNKERVAVEPEISNSRYLEVHSARRADGYDSVALPSVHRLRQREQTRLSPRFVDLFLAAAKKYELRENINMQDRLVETLLIADYKAESADALAGKTVKGDKRIGVDNKEELQDAFDHFARNNLSPYYPDDRSIVRVKEAIYAFFGGPLEMGVVDHFPEIVKITLSDSNKGDFIRVLENTKEKYAEETAKRKEPLQKTPDWEVAESVTYGDNYTAREAGKSVMQPFYAAKRESGPEKAFIELLEKSAKVKWWYKNGESESMYFAVPYTKGGEEHPFYVDFIVRFADGKIGLYDTKSGQSTDAAAEKSDGLLSYIKKQNDAGKRLRGGIIEPANPSDYSRGWKIYTGEGANIKERKSPEWEWLEL